MDTPLTFSRWLKRLRIEHGLTQEALAEQVGCSAEMIRAIEGVRRRPSRAMVERLVVVLQLPPDQQRAFLDAARALEVAPKEVDQPASAPAPPTTTTAQRSAQLHVPPTALFGRAAEVAEVCHLLRSPDAGLVSVIGPGGMGKTRLAVQVAAILAPQFADGAVLVALASVTAAEQVAATIGAACGCTLLPTQTPEDVVRAYLRPRDLLLVLDNMEHLLPAAPLLATILREAPGVRILTTSRERLHLRGEQLFALSSLLLPRDDSREAIEHADAVLLFVERTRRVVHDFVLTPDNRAVVARICRQLDGVPLAIELAAAWSYALTPAEIATELSRGLDLLASSDRDEDPRHRSMRAALDHSWALLTPDEQRTLARLSVFQGGWEREAAKVVTGADLTMLGALLDKSLVQREQIDSTTRYTLHELVRQYAAERLAEDDAAQTATEAHHAAYYAALLERSISVHTGGSSPEAWTQAIREMDNLRSAWIRAALAGDTQTLSAMVRGLFLLYDHRRWAHDGVTLFGQAADALRSFGASANVARGLILGTQAYFLQRIGQPIAGAAALKEGLALMQAAGATNESANLLLFLGSAEGYAARLSASRDHYTEAVRLATASGDDFTRLWAVFFLGIGAMNAGDFVGAEQHLTICLTAWRDQGFNRGLAAALVFLGETLRLSGRLTAAEAAVREGLHIGITQSDVLVIAISKREQGALALERGELDKAHRLLAESCAPLREMGDPAPYIRSRSLLLRVEVRLGLLAAARQGCAELLGAVRANFMMALVDAAYGLALVLATEKVDVVALSVLIALDGTPGEYAMLQLAQRLRAKLEKQLDPTQRAAANEQARAQDLLPWLEELCARPLMPDAAAAPQEDSPIVPIGGLYIATTGAMLSPREVEVLRLLMAGATNPMIAEALIISPYTVKHHVASILQKLGVTSRTQAALRGRELDLAPLVPQ